MNAAAEYADLAVVGAGAAGLMAAIAAGRERSRSRSGASILLLDSRSKVGAKILISGGTRCNVTNKKVTPSDYQGAPSHYVKHVFESFTPEQTIGFFEEIGVTLVLEPSGKYFPTTHSGRTVLEALLSELKRLEVPLVSGARLTDLLREEAGFELRLNGPEGDRRIRAKKIVLCTGGLSLPETGSDGIGLELARKLGHTIKPTFPALTPLTCSDKDWHSLSGITVDAALSFYSGGKKAAESQGSFLFTHFGFSGPAALDLSRHVASAKGLRRHVEASFVPKETDATLRDRFRQDRRSRQRPANFVAERFGLPSRLSEVLVKKSGLPEKEPLSECTPEDLGRLARMLLHAPLEVDGVVGYSKAEVTCGGVDLQDVKISTMESKIVPGLFFAGEILDVDGRIGGFNFQWAWSTGVLAGRGAMKAL